MFSILQSKSLTSDSGVLFSPPSIVKDALGDSGLLMDTDMSSGNDNPNDKSNSQVHSLTHKIETNLHVANQYYQSAAQRSSSRTNPSHNYQLSAAYNTIKSSVSPVKEKLSTIRIVRNSVNRNNENENDKPASKNARAKEYASFNPFADENDDGNSFQLSKTVNKPPARYVESSPFARTFGYNRTNIMGNGSGGSSLKYESAPGFVSSISTTSPKVSHFHIRPVMQNSSKSNDAYEAKSQLFRPLLPVNKYEMPATVRSSSFSEISQDSVDQMTFKNYDLNDEYWLNFDH